MLFCFFIFICNISNLILISPYQDRTRNSSSIFSQEIIDYPVPSFDMRYLPKKIEFSTFFNIQKLASNAMRW